MKKRLILGIIMSVMTISMIPGAAFAHVVVTPASSGIAEFVTFNVSVPNEKESAVTDLKLSIPNGLSYVTPTSKDGWTIDTTKKGDTITQIEWKNGTIPAGQRQDFTFSAQTPTVATDIQWKAYQTYADGTVVKWDQSPSNDDTEGEDTGPYSVTKIADDTDTTAQTQAANTSTLPLVLSIVAVILSAGSLLIRRRK